MSKLTLHLWYSSIFLSQKRDFPRILSLLSNSCCFFLFFLNKYHRVTLKIFVFHVLKFPTGIPDKKTSSVTSLFLVSCIKLWETSYYLIKIKKLANDLLKLRLKCLNFLFFPDDFVKQKCNPISLDKTWNIFLSKSKGFSFKKFYSPNAT